MPPLETARIYLDYNSTTPCDKAVIEEMLPFFAHEYANPGSPHAAGRIALAAVERAREQVAYAIGTNSRCLFFTGGATESNNFSLLGITKNETARRKIVVSAIEHKSVLEPCFQLLRRGYTIETIPVDKLGVVDIERAKEMIDDHTLIVSVQAANNETGVLQPIRDIERMAHYHGALYHCDAAQMLGKLPLQIEELNVDIASFSAHKVYGPKGLGALFLPEGRARELFSPILFGGGQEGGIRPGTANVPGIVGFGHACWLLRGSMDSEIEHISRLRNMCEKEITRCIPGSFINGETTPRLPGTISLTIPGVPADMLIANLETVCIGDGSACNSGAPEPSHVLLAMKLSRSESECTVRISIGRYTSELEIINAYREIITVATDLRVKLGLEPV